MLKLVNNVLLTNFLKYNSDKFIFNFFKLNIKKYYISHYVNIMFRIQNKNITNKKNDNLNFFK